MPSKDINHFIIQDTCHTFPITLDLWIYSTLKHFIIGIVTYLTIILLQFVVRLKYTRMITRYIMNRTTEATRSFCINTEGGEAGKQKYEEGFGTKRNKVKQG